MVLLLWLYFPVGNGEHMRRNNDLRGIEILITVKQFLFQPFAVILNLEAIQ